MTEIISIPAGGGVQRLKSIHSWLWERLGDPVYVVGDIRTQSGAVAKWAPIILDSLMCPPKIYCYFYLHGV